MNFYVINLKRISAGILAAAFTAACVGAIVTHNKDESETFSVGGRNIPIYSVERGDNKIALTFDCAWNADDIDSILATLAKHNAKATFFMLGTWAQNYPDAVKKIADAGHEIGNHSYNHTDYTTLSREEQLNDMQRADDIIAEITGTAPILFRAPSGSYNDTVVAAAEESGRIYVQWSRDTLDYTDTATKESIIKRGTENTAAGDIILLHNGTKYTAYALDALLTELEKSFELVGLTDLLYFSEFTVDAAGRQYAVK